MLLIKTDLGNFSDFMSLYFEMKNQKIERVHVTTTYVGTVVFNDYLAIDEVYRLYQESK